jgi:hypothetical protein
MQRCNWSHQLVNVRVVLVGLLAYGQCSFLVMFCITGKRAFIAGVADDQGFGWAIAKALSAAGAEILLGTWVPVHSPISVLCHFPSSRQCSSQKKIFFILSLWGLGTEVCRDFTCYADNLVAKGLHSILNNNKSNPDHVNLKLYRLLLEEDLIKLT